MVPEPVSRARLGDNDITHGRRLAIAVIAIADKPRPSNCWRCIGLISRVLQSRHHFAGLTVVLDDYAIIQQQIRHLSDARSADVVLVVNDTQAPLHAPQAPEALRNVPLLDGVVLPDPRIGFIGVIKLGLPLQATYTLSRSKQ